LKKFPGVKAFGRELLGQYHPQVTSERGRTPELTFYDAESKVVAQKDISSYSSDQIVQLLASYGIQKNARRAF